MYPSTFEYHAPATIQEALELLETYGDDAKVMSGGHSLIPLMKMRLSQPAHLIDMSKIPELKGIRMEGDRIEIGAFTTHRQVEISELLWERLPLLNELASMIADPQVRNRGTIGGSVCHADPGADFPAGMMALDAEMVCIGRSGARTVPAKDWFLGIMESAIGEDEILTTIRMPQQDSNVGHAYLKLPHQASRFAVVGAAALIGRNPDGTCSRARIGVTGVSTAAFRASVVEESLVGKHLSAEAIEAAARNAAVDCDVQGDLATPVEHKAELCRVMVGRAIILAAKRAITTTK